MCVVCLYLEGGREMVGRRLFLLGVYSAVLCGIITLFFVFPFLHSSPQGKPVSFSCLTPSLPSSMSRHQQQQQPRSSLWDTPVPAGTEMPPRRMFRLTKALLEKRVTNNVLIVTFGNYAFMEFILNWVAHLDRLNLSNFIVGAMDTKLLEALYWKGLPVFDMGSGMDPTDAGWGSHAFHKMGREKVLLINALLPFGYELLICDTDMVWLKNPLPYIARFPEADILTSTDELTPSVTDDSLEIWSQIVSFYNIGIFHWRPTNATLKLAKEWKDVLLTNDTLWDQTVFNDLVKRGLGLPVKGDGGLVHAYDGSLKLGILPASIFCSGHTYFVQRMPWQLKLEPYAVHATYQFSGSEGKRHRLREAMLFYDPPEYFDSPGGFLLFKPHIPKSLLLDGMHTVETHFSLVNYQMKQIRTALAIASLLNRTLVMPPLWCRLDRFWFPHEGIIPGSMTRQPFLCPLDHVFEVHVMLEEMSEEEFGPRIDFREYSFLKNPSLPKKVKESMIEVQLCEEKNGNCQKTKAGVVKLPKNSSEGALTQVFSAFKNVKVIEFSSVDGAFQGFTDKVREEKFRKRVDKYVGYWCCTSNGFTYYDMYWDEKADWRPNISWNQVEGRPAV